MDLFEMFILNAGVLVGDGARFSQQDRLFGIDRGAAVAGSALVQ